MAVRASTKTMAFAWLSAVCIASAPATEAAAADGSPVLITASVTKPEQADVLTFGVGGSMGPGSTFALDYALTAPQEGDVALHEFGLGLRFAPIRPRPRLPFEFAVSGRYRLLATSGLPERASLTGHSASLGASAGLAVSPTDALTMSAFIGPLWTTSSSTFEIDNEEVDKQTVDRALWQAGVSLSVHEAIAVAGDMTFGDDFRNPGISLTIMNTVMLKADVAYDGDREIPTYTLGFLVD